MLSPPDDESTIEALEDVAIGDGLTSPNDNPSGRLRKRDVEKTARDKLTEAFVMLFRSLTNSPDELKKLSAESLPRKFKTKNGLDRQSFKNTDDDKMLSELGRANCVAHGAEMIRLVCRALVEVY